MTAPTEPVLAAAIEIHRLIDCDQVNSVDQLAIIIASYLSAESQWLAHELHQQETITKSVQSQLHDVTLKAAALALENGRLTDTGMIARQLQDAIVRAKSMWAACAQAQLVLVRIRNQFDGTVHERCKLCGQFRMFGCRCDCEGCLSGPITAAIDALAAAKEKETIE